MGRLSSFFAGTDRPGERRLAVALGGGCPQAARSRLTNRRVSVDGALGFGPDLRLPSVTRVFLQTAPTELSIAFGAPDALEEADGQTMALFRPGRLVAYLARHEPTQALYIFKTTSKARGSNRLRHVSQPVKLF